MPPKRKEAEKDSYASKPRGKNTDKGRYDDVEPDARPTKRAKKQKDPNAPKRFMTAFFWFSQDERANVKADNPDAKGLGGVAKVLGRLWQDMDPQRKKRYEELAQKDRARYDKEMEEYKAEMSVGTESDK